PNGGADIQRTIRFLGDDNILRGLVIYGSQIATDPDPADTVDFAPGARRNRLERSRVIGPNFGDAVGAEGSQATPDDPPGDPSDANIVADSELSGAEDKGLKVTLGAQTIIRDSSVHDNRNGGVQATQGGNIHALRNLVQHNLGASAQFGLGPQNNTAGY